MVKQKGTIQPIFEVNTIVPEKRNEAFHKFCKGKQLVHKFKYSSHLIFSFKKQNNNKNLEPA